ncbi:hypothetical protein ASZ78_014881 [Callipepla squamata]|uniref:Uncharacterized protein n=1 Tax=Callipepla squamata TaxID=9009 RepID=A0A226NC61_CALSU|nr:hypothetical protein ASZ78_014881 [Callipepla squamata]
MSWLCACYRGRGPHKETEAMKRQSSDGEHEVIELPEVNGEESKADHTKPLNSQAPATSKERDQWKSCRKIIFWKCKLWMALTTIFVVLFLVILISLALYSSKYLTPVLFSDKIVQYKVNGRNTLFLNVFIFFFLSKITDVYSSSPALGRYFRTAKVDYFRKIMDRLLIFLTS